jgi:hypothetical protein
MRVTAPDEEDRILERASGSAPSAEDQILERARITLLLAAVAELASCAPELCAVLRGHLDGAPMWRVAADLGIPTGTAWSRWRLGCKAVRALIRQWAADDARGEVRMRLDAEQRASATSMLRTRRARSSS